MKKDTSKYVIVKAETFNLKGTLKSGEKFNNYRIEQADSLGILFDYKSRIEFAQIATFKFRPFNPKTPRAINGYFFVMTSVGLGLYWFNSFADGPYSNLPFLFFISSSIVWATLPPISIYYSLLLDEVSEKEVNLSTIQPIQKP